MSKVISKYAGKLFFKKWTIGVCRGTSTSDIIRMRKFDPDIKWIRTKSVEKFYADPFPYKDENGYLKILCESFDFDEDYGKISLLTLDASLKLLPGKVLLDTQSHLSYPLIYKENERTFVLNGGKYAIMSGILVEIVFPRIGTYSFSIFVKIFKKCIIVSTFGRKFFLIV